MVLKKASSAKTTSGAAKPKTASSGSSGSLPNPFSFGSSSTQQAYATLQNGVSSPAAKQAAASSLLRQPTQQTWTPPNANPSAALAAPSSVLPNSGGYTGGALGGGGAYSGFFTQDAGASATGPLSLEDFANGGYAGQDSTYNASALSAEDEFNNLIAQLGRQNGDYLLGFKDNLRSLGWDYNGEDYGNGKWNQSDSLGGYGQAYQGLQNDYSGRGMLDSSFYGQAQQDLKDRFDRQRTGLMNDLNTTNADFEANKVAAAKSKENAISRALADAYARYTGGMV